MLYRSMGKEKIKVSQLGFGAMRLPVIGGDNEVIDEKEAAGMIRYAIDNGLNYVDTAYVYHGGNSESFLSRALQDGYRQKTNLATKFPTWNLQKHEDFEKYLDIQLENLKTDTIDFYLIHALDREKWKLVVEHDVFRFIEKAKQSGKIRQMGFSFHDDHEVFCEILDAYEWDFCQIQLNYMDVDYQAGIEGLRYAGKKGIPVVIMEPVKGGNLAMAPPKEVQALWDSVSVQRSPVEWAFRFLYDLPEVAVVLSGMSTMEQVEQNMEIASAAKANTLTQQEKAIFKKVKDYYDQLTRVPCTGCQYCMPCPQNVNIPDNFRYYNIASTHDSFQLTAVQYYRMLAGSAADQCVSCKQCVEKCPQHIMIHKELDQVSQAFAAYK